MRNTIITIILFIATICILINSTTIQNFLTHIAADNLSKKFDTKVSVTHVRLDFLNHLLIQGVYVEDKSKDTLLYAGEIQIKITDWFIFKDKPVLRYIGLTDAYIHLYRKEQNNNWNYEFILDALNNGKNDSTTNKNKPFDINLNDIALNNVRLHIDDKWFGFDMDYDIGKFSLLASELDIKNKQLDISDITAKNGAIKLKFYKRSKYYVSEPDGLIDSNVLSRQTYQVFNPLLWKINSKKININNFYFCLHFNDSLPKPGEFNYEHIVIKNISMQIANTQIKGDTVFGKMEQLYAEERSGIIIKEMRSNISVSTVASICKNLYIETNNSIIKDYFAMHYKSFPDFLDFNHKVKMVGNVKDAMVDMKDIAYFAPPVKILPVGVLHVTGNGTGTVDSLSGNIANLTDGITKLKGKLAMVGLPDIANTKIYYSNGEINTNGNGIFKYFPSLINNPNAAFEKLTDATFKGNYEGYIDSFWVVGVFSTNLGALATDIKMKIPNFSGDSAIYSGIVIAEKLNIGTFLRQDNFGEITLNENIEGNSFNVSKAQINTDGKISLFTFNGYGFQNITTQGLLSNKQFNGKLSIEDPNLSMVFNGGIDYSQQKIRVNAKAYLQNCNFNAINLLKDTVTGAANFDLNCEGSNIDDFAGYANLSKIKLQRNNQRLALDSVCLLSKNSNNKKTLTIHSNDIDAIITGNYLLSKLPESFQYYFSGYIPNYIKQPNSVSPDQNLEFSIKTRKIDSFLFLSFDKIRGFNNSNISGSFNTNSQKLTLNAYIPNATFGNFHMGKITIAGQGNLNLLGLNTTIEYVAIGDSTLNGTLGITTTLSNDSLRFNIGTTTPDSSISIVLNGQITARKDSLLLILFPSEFYLNQIKWEIAEGCKATYCGNFLDVNGLKVSSGIQKITVSSQQMGIDHAIVINTENLNFGQLGTWAGMGIYQPDGKVNGTVKIINPLKEFSVITNIIGTDIKLGTEQIGKINLIGDYNGFKKLITLDPQTGIYRDNSSVVASGSISFDNYTNQNLDGKITFNNAPLDWSTPFLTGIFSKVTGNLNGVINFSGKSYEPKIDGNLIVSDCGVHLDYMGCSYSIPTAKVHLNNNNINFGNTTIYDSYGNTAALTGYFSHDLFKDMQMHIKLKSKKFEVMKLARNDDSYFYGNLIAGADSFTVTGYFNNVYLNAYNAVPAARSHIVIPVISTADATSYNYVTFKTLENNQNNQNKLMKINQSKLNLDIDANLNNLCDMTILLDPSTGDAIDARGEGNIHLSMPANNDMRITGKYNIDDGLYSFYLKQLFGYKKQFILKAGSVITFNGPFSETSLDVNAIYPVRARLSDLLTDAEKSPLAGSSELDDAKAITSVNVLMHMKGYLANPNLTFDLDVPDKHLSSNPAYFKLMQLNLDDRQKFDQVASLLLINTFIPPEGIGGTMAKNGVINNVSQLISGTASSGLTNIVKNIIGERKVNIAVNYQNYNFSDQALAINRSTASVMVSKNYFDDRLTVELGSKSDWGNPVGTNTSSAFNITGDFRIQYQISEASRLRLNCFRTSDYDVTLDRDIVRNGVGISWRKSFDNLVDFFKSNTYSERLLENQKKKLLDKKADTGNGLKP